ncbi:DUF6002 family protein [Streptomyces noursei]|uniref:DUF6002 family protein n=1 Tax=Streptomyces noursei TaxID=1971 RepID=UPI001673FB4D|nr:DUF6002 family protein [Streptomyces noursei]MCZ1019628.1 DUF6002 family protein [Streptomyces noursei]GGX43468.1 hypothetical protein GCM10010341_76660 [Streptomyces noursei]
MTTALSAPTALKNALAHYHAELQHALSALERDRAGSGEAFSPAFRLPDLSPALERFFSVSGIGITELPTYRGHTLRLLDLMRNPGTRTTKTLASLIIVARAVRHITETGERILIVTPSSANKATALRDAVYRAIATGLVTADQLQITCVVPEVSATKLWSSPLSEDALLRRRNPLVAHGSEEPASVKELAATFTAEHAERFWRQYGVRVWYTLGLDNYRAADMIRAFAERDLLPEADSAAGTRTHVHSVSSAFGLLGHDLGHRRVTQSSEGTLPRARYFLVQHLGTPDMVLSLRHGSHDRRNLPGYRFEPSEGLYRQEDDPHFPATTFDPQEQLDPTFYTRRPVTSAQMDPLIAAQGGGGIVVSLHECLSRYAQVRGVLAAAEVELPADPRRLREWSLVMAVTGTLNAADRGLLPDSDDVLIHGSGSYSDQDYRPVPDHHRLTAADVTALAGHVEDAVRSGTAH